MQVLAGLTPGEPIVTEGSFFLRAERERLGPRPGSTLAPSAATNVAAGRSAAASNSQPPKILVTEQGFEPPKVELRAGVAAQLTFIRTTDRTCGTEVVFPALRTRRALPLNQPVVIEFTPRQTGEVAFACGMGMLKGVVVVQ